MGRPLRRVKPMHHPRKNGNGNGIGAPAGNQNACREVVRDALLSVKCRKGDKARWIRAANKAHKAGLIDGVEKSVLAAWVIHTLNQAVAEQLTPKATR